MSRIVMRQNQKKTQHISSLSKKFAAIFLDDLQQKNRITLDMLKRFGIVTQMQNVRHL
ncbi:hypothetical protein AX25_14590 [Listeria ivanovii WSLC3009]|nr:hypothetical protein AX25_14590 [Listeria ivanovii WSLC3009]